MNTISVIFFLLVFVVGPIGLALYLRSAYPDRRRVGIALCLLFPLFGQFYKKGATPAIMVVFIGALLLHQLSFSGMMIWITMGVLSAAFMYRRFG